MMRFKPDVFEFSPPMANDPLESDLITAAVGGDREALQQLLFRRCPSVLRYLRAQRPADLADQIDLDDVLQDTLLAAVKDFARFRGSTVGEFRAWMRAIAQHRLQDRVKHLTAQKRRGSPALALGDSATSSIMNLAATLFDPQDTPARSCGRREAVDAVRVALAHLPDDQQQAVLLRYLQGKSTDETAREMDRSAGAVRGLIDRAKVSLRKLLGKSSRWFSWRKRGASLFWRELLLGRCGHRVGIGFGKIGLVRSRFFCVSFYCRGSY
jgi:RNA polymerase sigma-70 factor (ECF subfamily)